MFKFHFTNSTLDIQLCGLLPGVAIVIHVEKPSDDQPIQVEVKIESDGTN